MAIEVTPAIGREGRIQVGPRAVAGIGGAGSRGAGIGRRACSPTVWIVGPAPPSPAWPDGPAARHPDGAAGRSLRTAAPARPGTLGRVSERLPSPGPSYIREESFRLRAASGPGPQVRLGMTAPSVTDDGWWLTHLWAEDDAGVVDARGVAPLAGPPPGAPLHTIGPILAGALMSLLDQEDGRQLIRLRMPPATDESRPWGRPLLVMTAVRWDPLRAAAMRPNELARELLRAFARAVEAAGSPA